MAKAKQRRWVCPDCGTGVLAPERPRRDDVRRYCLVCSAKTGRLRERVCPSLEKERADRDVRRQGVAAAKRERERVRAEAAERARYVVRCVAVDGTVREVDVREEARLAAAALNTRMPEVDVRRRVDDRQGVSGRGSPWNGISITVWGDLCRPGTAERLQQVVFHEVCHTIPFGRRTATGKTPWHGRQFKRRLLAGARRRWPEIPLGVEAEVAVGDGLAYSVDDEILRALGSEVGLHYGATSRVAA